MKLLNAGLIHLSTLDLDAQNFTLGCTENERRHPVYKSCPSGKLLNGKEMEEMIQ